MALELQSSVGATPSGVPPGVSAGNGSEAPRPGASPSIPGGMTAGALPVGAIARLTTIPRTREAMKQVATMTDSYLVRETKMQ
ncbi:hypothetical protein BDV24DRAFT_127497 [Aspergillus arachidicola]|uniref:Uncharacterized protein n=1 Tax=Aspergillus arachidicola TaxID=656916 RepID=A0A5N6YFB6_9EURO|nr:hypothetical protein BDV24DRAFT_127497 [Aspergillus arachidicola]